MSTFELGKPLARAVEKIERELMDRVAAPSRSRRLLTSDRLESMKDELFREMERASPFRQIIPTLNVHPPSTFAGFHMIESEYLPRTRREQFRFPRSKKRRVRAKWARRERNWRVVPVNDVYMIDGAVYGPPGTVARIKHLASYDLG